MKLKQVLKYVPTYNTVEIEENLHVVASGKYGRTDCVYNDELLQKYLQKTVGCISAVDNVLRITVYDR